MFYQSFLIFSLLFFTSAFAHSEAPVPNERPLILKNCTSCHDIHYFSQRSEKAWELTVYRMREMLNDDEEKFSDDEAERMITFFSYHMNEDADILPDQLFPPGSEKIVEKKVVEKTELSPVPETQSQSVKNVTKTQPASPLKMEQTFNRKLTGFAKQCGYAAIILLLILLLSGAFRKQLGRQFTIIHRISAMLLLLCLAPHTAIYIMKYGNPPVLWYGLGIVGITTAILTQLTTVFRARIGRSFVKIHATIGVITLLIGLAHWIIAYL